MKTNQSSIVGPARHGLGRVGLIKGAVDDLDLCQLDDLLGREDAELDGLDALWSTRLNDLLHRWTQRRAVDVPRSVRAERSLAGRRLGSCW